MIFVDTNYFLRFLLKDNKPQHLEAKQLMLGGATGKLKLFTSTIVFFEIYWVLTSYYGKNKTELVDTLKDCYNLIYAKSHNAKAFKTFDLKLGRIFKK